MFRISCLFILSLCILFKLNAETTLLKNAIETNLVSISIEKNENSTHYHAPFRLFLKSNSNKPLSIKLENGSTLIADQEEFQNFIITEQRILALRPNESKDFELKAMCIEQSDRAPDETSTYALGGKAKDVLCDLSRFIEDNKSFEPDAQFLMWRLASNNLQLKEDEYFVLNKENEILLAQKDASGNQVFREVEEVAYESQKELKVYGNFSMTLSGEKKIHIAMFNMDNVLVKELYNNPETPAGENKVEYAFNSLAFPDEKYKIKLVMNGSVMMQEIVVMNI